MLRLYSPVFLIPVCHALTRDCCCCPCVAFSALLFVVDNNTSLLTAVPGHILPQLVQKQQFRCPYCHSVQNVNLAPDVAHQIMSKQQRQDQWQRQMQADWAQASSLMHQDHNRLAASQQYSQVLLYLLLGASLHTPACLHLGFSSTPSTRDLDALH